MAPFDNPVVGVGFDQYPAVVGDPLSDMAVAVPDIIDVLLLVGIDKVMEDCDVCEEPDMDVEVTDDGTAWVTIIKLSMVI